MTKERQDQLLADVADIKQVLDTLLERLLQPTSAEGVQALVIPGAEGVLLLSAEQMEQLKSEVAEAVANRMNETLARLL